MRGFIVLFATLGFVMGMVAYAVAGDMGSLVVIADPPSTVFVDGAERGTTPLELELEEGDHAVRFTLEDGRSKEFTRHVSPGRMTKVYLRW